MKLVLIATRKVIWKRSAASKHNDNKLAKVAEKVSAVMAYRIAASNKEAMESILNKLDKLNLKGMG